MPGASATGGSSELGDEDEDEDEEDDEEFEEEHDVSDDIRRSPACYKKNTTNHKYE